MEKDNGAHGYTEAANYTTEEQLKKEEIYLNLRKLSDGKIKEIYKKIKNSDQNIHTPTKRDLINGIVTHRYWFLFFDGNAWNQNETPLSGKTELTYPEFIKLFEGGESKEDFAIYKRTFNNIPYPRVEWECNCGFKHCLNEGFEQDYRKDNFKEIRLPNGNCLKCKKEIKTHSLESKEVLQVENKLNADDLDFITDALNFYFHDAHNNLERKVIGDIEKKNYQYQLEKAKELIKKLTT